MAYSRSEQTLIKMLPALDNLQRELACSWGVEAGTAHFHAQKIREALFIAREVFPEKYPELARAAKNFVIEVTDAKTVQARPRDNTPASAISPLPFGDQAGGSLDSSAPETPIHGLALASGVPRQISGPKSATDIIAYCLRALPTNDKLVFTNADLSEVELTQLARWAATRTPRWMVVRAKESKIVTLGPWQPGVPAWGTE